MSESLPELMTVDDAAAYLSMTPTALRIAICRGQIPGVVRIGRRVRVRTADLRKHLGIT